MAKTITFLKENLCIFKCFIDVLQIFLFGAREKLQNVPRFEMDFVLNLYHVLSRFHGLRAGGMMNCGPCLELLGFCPPLGQFNGVQ